MHSSFWSYTIWYLLLAVLTILELIYVMIKTDNRRLVIAFFLTILGIVLSYETIILIFMRAYIYYPMVLKDPPFAFDTILVGNLFSQFSVSTTALLATVLKLGYHWYIVIGMIYGIIEEAFLALGIYSHNWYQTWMTVVSIPLYFLICKNLYRAISQGITPVFYYGCVFLGLFPLYVITIMWGFMVSGYLAFSKTIFSDPISSHYFLCLAVFAIPSAIVNMFIYFKKLKWPWKVMAIFMLYLFYFICYKLQLILVKAGFFFQISTITIVWMYLSVLVMDKLYDTVKVEGNI